MKVLITGGTGFIGSHSAEELLGGSNKVYTINDLSFRSIENTDQRQKREIIL